MGAFQVAGSIRSMDLVENPEMCADGVDDVFIRCRDKRCAPAILPPDLNIVDDVLVVGE